MLTPPAATRRRGGASAGGPRRGRGGFVAPLPGMSRELFERFSVLIHEECGIRMPPAKKTMLEARLRKRLRALSLETFEEYCRHLFAPGGLESELVHLLDVVTTNKTDFFREGEQFELLLGTVLPHLLAAGRGRHAPLRFWSAGCSTGEEPYSLAMTLEEYRERRPEFRYEILATDLSTRVLAVACRGVYHEERVRPVPSALRRKYLLRSRDRSLQLVRVAPELRSRVTFARLNFREPDAFGGPPMDVIFCRNVLIYFEKEFQRELLRRFCERLAPGGYLFLGHTESIHGLGLPLVTAGFSCHRRPE